MKPQEIENLEALLRRIPPNHPSWTKVVNRYAKKNAGFQGEKSLEYYFSFLDPKEYLIIHNIRLPYQSNYFQIDFFVIHAKFILILEVKNISGTLIFDPENAQLIRQIEDREEIFKDPIEQAEHQAFQFRKWLVQHKFSQIPVKSIVVIANDRTKITSKGSPSIIGMVFRNTKILKVINEQTCSYKQDVLSKKDLKRLKRQLNKENTPTNPDLINIYKIKKEDIMTGVCCPYCSSIPMTRIYGKWICSNCDLFSDDAHLKALQDYSVLINPFITNTEFKNFLHLKTSRTAHRMIETLNLKPTGTTRNRVYDLNSLFKK
ncbi:nuclease-related domain-containing protein [Pseudalkalibacillus berkeleyi]|uniref:NERD domain-containing protein n=1 Tax=Pseudalkalibacillus berkeleyi TaxID=1069813 RepID=A0ABS9H3Z5_9BACL|nr:nuclease-related domain-containing protein [Pseudalkalibacillus berkeleyi]MCF6138644.1 NERD domain-containing protein [Pseudalkalibacillus berkeleyi]